MTDRRPLDVWTLLPGLGDGMKDQILSRYMENEEPTLYGLFQAGTAVFHHRGQTPTAADFSTTTRL